MIGTARRDEYTEDEDIMIEDIPMSFVCPECGKTNTYDNVRGKVCVDCETERRGEYIGCSQRMTSTQKRMSIYTRLPLSATMFVKVGGAVLDVEDIILSIQGALERNNGLFILNELPEFNGLYLFKSPDCAIEVMVMDRGFDFFIILMGYGDQSYVEDIIDEAVKQLLNGLPSHAVPDTVMNWVA